MTVEWSAYASEHLQEIVRTIALERGFAVARKWKARLESVADQLAFLPQVGSIVREIGRDDIREVGFPPYRVIYRVLKDSCVIFAVLHSRQAIAKDEF